MNDYDNRTILSPLNKLLFRMLLFRGLFESERDNPFASLIIPQFFSSTDRSTHQNDTEWKFSFPSHTEPKIIQTNVKWYAEVLHKVKCDELLQLKFDIHICVQYML